MADEDLWRAHVEAVLLEGGIPWPAIEGAPDEQTVLRWFVVANERVKMKSEAYSR
jgi:hypothetical protein